MNEKPKRRLKKRHVAGGGFLAIAAAVLVEWANVAPEVCPVLPARVARAICAEPLLDSPAADGGVP